MAGKAPNRVEVVGLKEVAKGFKAIDASLGKELQQAFKAIADHVVGVAQQRMPFRTGTAAKSLKPRATARGSASIAFPAGGPGSGNTKTGYYPWLDFGGGKAGSRGITSSSPVAHAKSRGGFKRPVISGGRFLYPAIAESHDLIADEALDAIETIAKHEGFKTHG